MNIRISYPFYVREEIQGRLRERPALFEYEYQSDVAPRMNDMVLFGHGKGAFAMPLSGLVSEVIHDLSTKTVIINLNAVAFKRKAENVAREAEYREVKLIYRD